MNHSDPNVDRVLDLTEAACDDVASRNDLAELDTLLLVDRQARREYEEYYRMHVALRLQLRANRAAEKVQQHLDNASATPVPANWSVVTGNASSTLPLTFPGSTIGGSNGLLSAGWPVAYLVATVVFGIALSIAAIVDVSNPEAIVKDRIQLPAGRSATSAVVGRVTGMVDCVLKNDECRMLNAELKTDIHHSSFIIHHSPLHLGDRLALRSGLLEITYDTGAVVILQGPVTYEVESPTGGYLSIGKLTAKLEKRSAVSGQRSGMSNPQSLIANPLFSVRTPTAVVTDLGTEFGVEVSKSGLTKTHVFRGSVRLEKLADDRTVRGEGRVLHQNESASVGGKEDSQITTLQPSTTAKDFVRTLPKLRVKTFDLVDIVAGGDGFSGKRGRGINPADGRVTALPPNGLLTSDGKYHRVEGIPFVDGVFIPQGGVAPVQLDSAGHVFTEFGNTNNITVNHVWAGGDIPTNPPHTIPTTIGGVDYASRGHGLLFMHANKGITFDLEAIRRANPGSKLVRFTSAVANVETAPENGKSACADFWVLIDGRVGARYRAFNHYTGTASVSVPFDQSDRFLTLVATDGGDGIEFDWIIFGDPRLELMPATSEKIQP